MTGSVDDESGTDRPDDRRRELRDRIATVALDLVLERGLAT